MCKPTAAEIKADGAAVGDALEQIAALPLLKTADPTADAALEAAGEGIITATANWQTGSTTAVIEDAENAAVVALNLIPVTTPYAGVVALAFAALNILIANISTQPAQAAASGSMAKLMIVMKAANANPTNSPWFGKANIELNHGNFRKGFEDQWKAEMALHPEFGLKAIKV
jgi:hypothetical protein